MTEGAVRVLIVDDDPGIRKFLRVTLSAHHYEVIEAATARDALALTVAQRPDIVILDLGLPDGDGLEVITRLREWAKTPIIVLSVRDQEDTKVAALDSGADDYLTKPFGVRELLARIRLALRHASSPVGEPVIRVDELTVDLARRRVTLGNRDVRLTPTEYDLLKALVTYPGRVVTHRQLLRQVWGPGYENEFHLLRVNVSNLRRKLEPDPARPRFIFTEPGVGYRFRDRPDPHDGEQGSV